jgi:excisionase family DNA binding protein
MDNYEQWLTIEEASQKTGISKRTLQRKLEKGEIRKAHRNIPGGKPLPILNPADIEALTQQTLKPVPVPKDLVPRQTAPRHNDIASLAQVLTQSAAQSTSVTLDKKSHLLLPRSIYPSLPSSSATCVQCGGQRTWLFWHPEPFPDPCRPCHALGPGKDRPHHDHRCKECGYEWLASVPRQTLQAL